MVPVQPVTPVNISVVPPVTVSLFEMIAAPPLVTVTVTGFCGVTGRQMFVVTSRFTPVVTLPMLIIGAAVTVAVICVYCDGVLKPAGVPTVRLVIPAATGWKVVEPLDAPEANTTGLVVIVPIAVLELVTGTLTGASPGFKGKLTWFTVREVGFNEAVYAVTVVGADNVVVENLNRSRA